MEWRGGYGATRTLTVIRRYFFERRGREDYAEAAEEKQPNFVFFLRPLRNLRVLCVQNLGLTRPTFMKITFKLFATLGDYLPANRKGNEVEIEVDPEHSILQIIKPYGLPPKLVHLVLVNGHYINPEDRSTRTLLEGDALAIWPPIAGG